MSQLSNINNTASHRRIFRLVLLVAALGFGLKAFLLSPLYVRFATDVAFQDTWWVNILYFLTDGGLIDLAVFAVCYPATLYAVRNAGLKSSLSIPVAFSVCTLVKFLANFFMDALSEGALPDIEDFLTLDLPMILVMVALELLQYILVILIALFVRWRYDARIRVAEGMKLLPRNQRVDYPLPPADFPFTGLYTRRNALQRGGLLTAISVTLWRVVMHLIYQIAQFTQFGSSEGWVVMLIDLVGDIVIGAVFYFVGLLLMMYFRQKEDAAPNENET